MSEYKSQISGPIDEQIKRILNGDYSELSQAKLIVVVMYLRYLKRIDANQKKCCNNNGKPFYSIRL